MNLCHTCQVEATDPAEMTIDELAALSGTTTRRIRSFQTQGLLPHPELRGRTGLYTPAHLARVIAVVRLQDRGFSLESLAALFGALAAGRSLADVLGVSEPAAASGDPGADATADTAELYGFAELEPPVTTARRGRAGTLLSVVPTTVWDESEAS
jgi:DNA-binding transcriptional MerR regulator